jgi:cell shape-determining protein MreC
VIVARGRIVGRTLRAGRRYGELDIGRLDGVEKGMPVADGWALAGTVAGTDDGRCLIQFTSDAESRIAAQVIAPDDEGKPRILCEGVVAGTGKRGTLALEFVDAISGLDLAPGMDVVTAGGDARLPPGMVLGTITAAGRGGGDHWLVDVKPHRDPELAESLLVLRLAK